MHSSVCIAVHLKNTTSTIQSYLRSDALKDRQTGIIAAGGSGDKLFTDRLKEMLAYPRKRTDFA